MSEMTQIVQGMGICLKQWLQEENNISASLLKKNIYRYDSSWFYPPHPHLSILMKRISPLHPKKGKIKPTKRFIIDCNVITFGQSNCQILTQRTTSSCIAYKLNWRQLCRCHLHQQQLNAQWPSKHSLMMTMDVLISSWLLILSVNYSWDDFYMNLEQICGGGLDSLTLCLNCAIYWRRESVKKFAKLPLDALYYCFYQLLSYLLKTWIIHAGGRHEYLKYATICTVLPSWYRYHNLCK